MRRLSDRASLAVLSCAGALGLSACAVGPNYRQPPAIPHADGGFVSARGAGATTGPPRDDWWRLYNDPTLNDLIAKALVANTDLRQAEANLAKARATLGEARAAQFPGTTLSGGTTYGRSATADDDAASSAALHAALANVPGANPSVFGPTNAKAGWIYQAGFDMSYEVDLFGRVRRSVEAARADTQSVEAARDAVRLTVEADVARAYLDGCAYAEELTVAQRNLTEAQSDLDLTNQQFRAGTLSQLEAARAQTVAEQARAVIPVLEGQRSANLFALAALLGVAPKDAPQGAGRCAVPPKLTTPIPAGDGITLLLRRPDVREAERSLAAETARIGVATASLYPTISLGASIATTAPQGANALSNSFVSYGVGPLISWNFPNVLVARARIGEQRATAQAALAGFNGTMLTALKEAEQALATYGAELDHNAALIRARDASQTAYTLVQQRYRAGTISQLDLISAEQTLIQAEQALALSDQSLAEDQVAVFKALGGGWKDAPPT
jgi:NodT family efflux transporter outer membrane factor (OMF) lipoprotein